MAGPRPRAPAPSRVPPALPRLAPPSTACKKIAYLCGSTSRRKSGRRGTEQVRSGMEGQVLFPRHPVSHPVVHPLPAPVEAPAPAPPAPVDPAAAPAVAAAAAPNAPAQGQEQGGPNAPPGVRMRAPTRPRLWLRILQALLAAAALAPVASARDFASVTAFRFLVSATALQCLWCLALSILYYYALLVGRSYRSRLAVAIICAGDWITGALTFSAACASASITTFLNNDMEACYENHCPSFMSATAMAFLSWFSVAPGCVSNLIEVVYKLQRPQQ